MIGQKTAVVNTILSVLKDRGEEYVLNGEVNLKDVLTKEDKDKIKSILCEGFHEGEINMTESAKVKYVGNEVQMRTYVNGLLNNWIRKNKEFNNGVGYIPKNPGSRTGQSDEVVKNLRLMKKTTTDVSVLEEIEKCIQERLLEIKPESVVVVDESKIPEHLRKFIK